MFRIAILILTAALAGCAFNPGCSPVCDLTDPPDIASGPFEASVESLENYECPEWFQDAKFGIYVHWGVYSVPERGEWYAREMYMEELETNNTDSDTDKNVYDYHCKTYGHPTEFGYHDFIPMWKAENFDPDAWMDLFVEAGAKYFTPCATHHDGFSLWNDPYTPFNAVEMGPQKDLLGMMREAALKRGLRFGVTTHMARSISWMQTAHWADTEGPLKGVKYCQAAVEEDPRLQDLYMIDYADSSRADTVDPPAFWREYWLLRMKSLIAQYRPDFIYLDSAVPFAGTDHGETGLRLFAHFYNSNAAWHGGSPEGVMTHKGDKGSKRAPYFPGIATLDIERGKSSKIRQDPWQTDDSIGPWGYNAIKDYKDANAVIDKMLDVVSKNGNFLLNVPPRADGTLDDATVAVLKEIGAWFKINGEGIYSTRPWEVFGEGPNIKMRNRANVSPYTAECIRYTRSKDGSTLYAIEMAWPGAGAPLTLTRFADGEPGSGAGIKSVSMLGCDEEIEWTRDDAGLHLTSPGAAPDELAVIYKIELAGK